MIRRDPLAQFRRQRQVEHLHRLGARAVGEALLELANEAGDPDALDLLLARYGRLTVAMVRLAGGDRFAPAPVRRVA